MILLGVFHCVRVASWFQPGPNFIRNDISVLISHRAIESGVFVSLIVHPIVVACCLRGMVPR